MIHSQASQMILEACIDGDSEYQRERRRDLLLRVIHTLIILKFCRVAALKKQDEYLATIHTHVQGRYTAQIEGGNNHSYFLLPLALGATYSMQELSSSSKAMSIWPPLEEILWFFVRKNFHPTIIPASPNPWNIDRQGPKDLGCILLCARARNDAQPLNHVWLAQSNFSSSNCVPFQGLRAGAMLDGKGKRW